MTYGPIAPKPTPTPQSITLPEQIQAVGNEIDRLPAFAYLRSTKLLAVLATLVALSEERRKRQIRRHKRKYAQPKGETSDV
jgi:hypothetical protein